MPVTVNQLKQRIFQKRKQYEELSKQVFAFSELLYAASETLKRGNDYDFALSTKLREYSTALEKVSLDPTDERNRQKIDESLELLSTLGDFLGGKGEQRGNYNVCDRMVFDCGVEIENIRSGLKAFNNFYGFGLDVEELLDGEVIELTPQQKQAQNNTLEQWRTQRSTEQAEATQRQKNADIARQRELEEQERRRQEQKDIADREKREAEERERIERERREAEERERNKTEQQRILEREQALQAERDRRARLRTDIPNFLERARNPRLNPETRKTDLAQAVAYYRELDNVGEDMSKAVSLDRINNTMQNVYGGAAITVAERRGTLAELSAMSAKDLNDHVIAREREISEYAEGNADSARRAGWIYAQMNRTWRIGGSSGQFNDAKQAMQELSGRNPPAQVDNYLATQTVQTYISKNVIRANSAVGRTRMACSMAFLKQTMSPAQFKAYCGALNHQRGILPQITANGSEYDKTNPRCFVPEEIGTINEVYAETKERFYHLYDNETGYKMPSARDLAMLTALKRLQAKAGNDGNKVVEHEALQAEIEKVQADRRFRDAIHNRSPHELIEMAIGSNLDTLAGYAAPLTQDQQNRVQDELKLQTRKKAEQEDRLKAEEEARKREEQEALEREQERKRKEQEDLERARREEQERLKREKEEAEFREKNKPVSELYEKVLPDVLDLADGQLNEILDHLENGNPHQDKATETFATLIALHEARVKASQENKDNRNPIVNLEEFGKRVDELKNDPIVQRMSKEPKVPDAIKQFKQEAATKRNLNAIGRKLYPASRMSEVLYNVYTKTLKEKKEKESLKERWKKGTDVSTSYATNAVKESTDRLLSGRIDSGTAATDAALLIAVYEFEKKGGGLKAPVDFNTLFQRRLELKNDPAIIALGQDLSSPFRENKLSQAVNNAPNREQAVAKALDEMYQKKLAERQQNMEKQKLPDNQPAVNSIHP